MPRIYAASLSDYNNGILHGSWIDLAGKSADDIGAEIQKMLDASPAAKRYGDPAEEWAIHDSEGCGKLSENPDLDDLEAIGNADPETLPLLLELVSGGYASDLADAIKFHEENYRGQFKTLEDYAEEYLNDTGAFEGAPDLCRQYFNFEAFSRDLELGGDVFTIETGHQEIHVYTNS